MGREDGGDASRKLPGGSALRNVIDAVRAGDMRTITQLASAPLGIVGILLVLLGLLGACQPQPQQLGTIPGTTLSPATASQSTAASVSATPNAQVPAGPTAANRPPNVGGIIATFVQPVTSYTVQASDPDGDPLRYSWTSTNPCGTYTGAATETYAWSHPHPPCPDEASHPGTISVLVNDGHFVVTREYQRGSLAGTGAVPPAGVGVASVLPSPTTAPTAAATSTPSKAPTATATAGTATTSGGGPNVPLVLGGLVLSGVGAGLYWTGRRSEPQLDPCAEQKRRVAAAKAAAAAARARKQRIDGLKAASDKAQADLQRAQREQANATDDRHVSWGEDVETGQRVYTNKDQKARIDAANAALTAAQTAAASAKSAYEGAGNGREQQQAQYAVEDADRELQRAEEALARCLQINAPAPAPTPPPPPPSSPTSTGGATTGGASTSGGATGGGGVTTAPSGPVVATPPPTVATTSGPKTQVRRECEDGAEPRVDVTERDFELYLVWAGKWQVDGAFQFSEDDVDEALQNYKKFKTIVDIAQVVEGLSGVGSTGIASVETALHVMTQGVKQAASAADVPNPIDPSDASQWGVEKALEKLIERVNRLRALGTWTLTCPRVRVHATCRRTFECRSNRWVLTQHDFKLEYGDQVGTDQTSFENVDQTDPARGSREAHRRLTRYFEQRNKPAMDQIKAMVQRCVAP